MSRSPGRRSPSSGSSELLVLVVADPGHKDDDDAGRDAARAHAARVRGRPGGRVELDPHARTVDSLEERRPEDALFVLGADELADFESWKRPERVLELVRLGSRCGRASPRASVERARATRREPDRIVELRDGARRGFVVGDPRARRARRARSTGSCRRAVAEAIARSVCTRARRVDCGRNSDEDARETDLTPLEQARRTAALCQEKLATDVTILDMRGVCDFTDFFVIATGPQRAADEGDLRRGRRRPEEGARAPPALDRRRDRRRPGSSPTTSTSSSTSSRPRREASTGSRSSGATCPSVELDAATA